MSQNLNKAELLHKLGRLAHRRYDTDAYPEAIEALLEFIDDPEIEDAFRRVPEPDQLDDEEEN